MENENLKNGILGKDSPYLVPMAIVIAGVLLSLTILFKDSSTISSRSESKYSRSSSELTRLSAIESAIRPSEGVELPVTWGEIGSQLVQTGVIDADKFRAIYNARGTFTEEYEKLLLAKDNGKLRMTKENASYLLNLFWALGLANRNPILETGEMMNPAYGGAGNFASTGGWTMAVGSTMTHYSKHTLINLTPEQQRLVEKVSRGIYRPCCNNSTHFPDCNHGMAMLGLLELLASQGAGEQEMWRTALAVNSYWFPDTYTTLATYMQSTGVKWKNVDPQEILGIDYSSASGYTKIAAKLTPSANSQGGGCAI